ncbi:hypothetical protein O0L34_g1031 [Tuta absoluta]|nr:hypothetical protein O0L34_g1031 [Tuta absoluta]
MGNSQFDDSSIYEKSFTNQNAGDGSDKFLISKLDELKTHFDTRMLMMKTELLKEVDSRLKSTLSQISDNTKTIEDSISKFNDKYNKLLNIVKDLDSSVKTLQQKEEQAVANHNKLSNAVSNLETSLKTLQNKEEQAQIDYDKLTSTVFDMDVHVNTLMEKERESKSIIISMRSEISLLQAQMDDLENRNRACNLEIRGIPESKEENLLEVLETICKKLSVTIDKTDIYTIFRTGRMNDKSKCRTIRVLFKNIFPRNDLLRACKEFHKNCKDPNMRLNSNHLGFNGEAQPVFICEHLSPNQKSLLIKSKNKKKSLNFKFCWVSNGKIFLRQDHNSPIIWIKNEEFLDNLLHA